MISFKFSSKIMILFKNLVSPNHPKKQQTQPNSNFPIFHAGAKGSKDGSNRLLVFLSREANLFALPVLKHNEPAYKRKLCCVGALLSRNDHVVGKEEHLMAHDSSLNQTHTCWFLSSGRSPFSNFSWFWELLVGLVGSTSRNLVCYFCIFVFL